MEIQDLKLGGIYKLTMPKSDHTNTCRIIGLDEFEVFYDCLKENNLWMFSGNFKKKCYFYCTSASAFANLSTPEGFNPLTKEEELAFRPDLPIRFGRTKDLNWNQSSKTDFEALFKKGFANEKLPTDKIVLLPRGNNGGLKKGIVVASENDNFLKCSDIILKAKEIQEAVSTKTSYGIGIFRIGMEKGLPSYYVGDYFDMAEIMTE